MMNGNAEKLTLLGLLEKYRVVVPRIQRDYVHGRKDDHSSNVRKNLLEDIKNATPSEPLDLNFVYGKVKGDTFYPVDGQQRITTLFLLHIFAFAHDDSKTDLLKKFSYEARTTTRDFFARLVDNRASVFTGEKPSEVITDAEWFIDSWKYDPSVTGAMVVLDAIAEKNFDVSQLEDTSSPKVFFWFIDLEELGREDDLYIKLNARGRPLTPFENFKSKFVGQSDSDYIKHKLDTDWADVIWSMGKTDFDKLYMRFFEILLSNSNIMKSESLYDIDYKAMKEDTYRTVRNTFDYLVNFKDSEAYSDIERILKGSASYPDRVLFHAVSKYLSEEDNPQKVDVKAFSEWLRVIKNLVANSRIDEAKIYRDAIDSINALYPHRKILLQYLASGAIESLSGFLGEQVKEECMKAKIMLKDDKYYKAIIDVEVKLPYFSGQIRRVLYLSGVII